MDTHYMTKRLQVLFEDGEYAALQAAAASRGMTVAEWVRQALAEARRDASTADVDRKLAAIRAAVRHAAPTGSIERLTADIERGYGATPEASPASGGY
ncbi:MAG: hypothetical protein RL580_1081 [Pseudomonadota bacterium]|jgi:2-oxo-4-hydroxy-4-carboxy--5-ureidoimidazoline (OHCU) decarboxylase